GRTSSTCTSRICGASFVELGPESRPFAGRGTAFDRAPKMPMTLFKSKGPHSLARRLALWIALSTAVSLGVFAATAYAVLVLQEESEADADSPEAIEDEAGIEVGEAMLLAGPLALVLAVAGVFVFTRHALRPLEEVIRSATEMTPHVLHRRLPIPS